MERLTVIPIWKKKGLRTLGLNRKIWTNFKRNFKQKSRGWPYISNIKNGSMNKMKQEKSSPTWRKLYATHIFAKFLDFGQKYYQSSTLSCRATAKFGFLDSAQRKIGCLNLTKLERNLKPAGRRPEKNKAATRCFHCLSLRFKFISYKSTLHFLFAHCVNYFLDNY